MDDIGGICIWKFNRQHKRLIINKRIATTAATQNRIEKHDIFFVIPRGSDYTGYGMQFRRVRHCRALV